MLVGQNPDLLAVSYNHTFCLKMASECGREGREIVRLANRRCEATEPDTNALATAWQKRTKCQRKVALKKVPDRQHRRRPFVSVCLREEHLQNASNVDRPVMHRLSLSRGWKLREPATDGDSVANSHLVAPLPNPVGPHTTFQDVFPSLFFRRRDGKPGVFG
jgi:hypothetical protein